MAIYHFSAQIISRSQGRSSVAASAYRSASKLRDERVDVTHDFTHKNDVIQSEILLSEGAPTWMGEREALWNAVEQTEKRKDAQVAREINIALPKELTHEQNWALAKAFVQKEFVDKGMVADLNFHSGHKDQEEQPHVHVMLTMREVTPEGFGQKNRAWNNKELLNEWRERWAEYCNRELSRFGFDMTIDHRTLEAQGIHLEPQSKIGAKSAQIQMARFEEHQALAKRNGERLLDDPRIALHALTHQQSTFTHQDLARFVNRHTVSEEQFKVVYEKVKAHPDLVHVGRDDKQRDRYTTREMLTLETGMIEQANVLLNKASHGVNPQHQTAALNKKSLSPEQKEAFQHLTASAHDIACVVGFAGTGKSYMLGAAKEAWEAEGYRVHGMALSGIAAENLEADAGIKSRTVASRLWHWERDRERLTANDIVVVDEAGMLGSRQMAKVMDEVNRAKAKIVLVGDPEQLQAIEAGAAFRAITEKTGFALMNDIRRQSEPWQQQATRDFATQKTEAALLVYEKHNNVHVFAFREQAIQRMVEQWDEARSQAPNKSQIMLAYTRVEVQTLNEKARQLRQRQGELGENHEVETTRGKRQFAEGDRLYFLRNERDLGVKNGTLGTLEKIDNKTFHIRLDVNGNQERRRIDVNVQNYNDIDHGYAATVYKAQGVTVDRSHVLASKYFDRHSTYVAMTRHREGVDVYYDHEQFPRFSDLSQSLSQERTKDTSLDYSKARGFDEGVEISVKSNVTHTHTSKEETLEKVNMSSFDEPLSSETKARYDALLRNAAREYNEQNVDKLLQRYDSFHQFSKDKPTEKITPVVSKEPSTQKSVDAWDAFCKKHDFSQFIMDYEKHQPEKAAEFKEAARPLYERVALDTLKELDTLEKSLENAKGSWQKEKAQEQFSETIGKAFKQSGVQDFLKENHTKAFEKIQTVMKENERGRSRGGMEYGEMEL